MRQFTTEMPAAMPTIVSDNRTGLIETSVEDERERFVEAPGCRNRSGRGALTGVVLGAGLWTLILAAAGVIKF